MTATEQRLHAELAQLRARYDDGAVSAGIAAVIKALEQELSWLQHKGTQHGEEI
jgi:hypothetical protein